MAFIPFRANTRRRQHPSFSGHPKWFLWLMASPRRMGELSSPACFFLPVCSGLISGVPFFFAPSPHFLVFAVRLTSTPFYCPFLRMALDRTRHARASNRLALRQRTPSTLFKAWFSIPYPGSTIAEEETERSRSKGRRIVGVKTNRDLGCASERGSGRGRRWGGLRVHV